jgi:hypothetical protein
MLNYPFCNPNSFIQRKGCLKINGVGIAKAEPNMAVVNLGITTENTRLVTAQEENAIRSNAVISTLYQMGISKKQISTASYTVDPQYDYVDEKQVFRAYSVANILSVTITNIEHIGNVIDNAIASGANRVESIAFTVDNPYIYYSQALNQAIRNAVQKAIEIGHTLGVEVDETPIKITEESVSTIAGESPMVKLSTSTTPILPGQIHITARVEAAFDY